MPVTSNRVPQIDMQTVSGVELRAAYWPAEIDTGKRPLLFFNGIGANLELVFKLGEVIRDREILTFDVPGIGESPQPKYPYRIWQLARWAKKLAELYGFDELDVMGVSWGGAIAQQFALQYRQSVKRVVLAATSSGWTMVPGRPEALAKMADPRRYVEPDYMRKNFETLYGDQLAEDGIGHTLALKAPTTRGYMFQMLAVLGWSSLPFLPFLKQPILVLMGDKDNIVPLINGKIIERAAANGRLEVIENGGHLFLVTRAETTLPLITDFLDEDQVFAEAAE